MAERLEESTGATPVQGSEVIKTKFVSMVEQHYFIRVRPPVTELVAPSNEGEGAGKMPIFGKFELPSSLSGVSCYKAEYVYKQFIIQCLAIKYTGKKQKREGDDITSEPSSKRAKKYCIMLSVYHH